MRPSLTEDTVELDLACKCGIYSLRAQNPSKTLLELNLINVCS